MLKIEGSQSFKSRGEWRAWLAKNHSRAQELWLIFYNKRSAKPSISHQEAVEEALCYGWIDGLLKKIDEEKYALRFSPRRSGSIWSELNKRRVGRMIEQGLMTEFGQAKIEEAKRKGEWTKAVRRENAAVLPAELDQALKANSQARRNYESLPPSQRRLYVFWVAEAKKDETRQKRVRAAVKMLNENKRIGIDTRMKDWI
jgi:uncharacterized protein YdeI (YjbR/CyaY-like superfamily)